MNVIVEYKLLPRFEFNISIYMYKRIFHMLSTDSKISSIQFVIKTNRFIRSLQHVLHKNYMTV